MGIAQKQTEDEIQKQIESWKKEKQRLEAEIELLNTEKKLLEAQKELMQAKTPEDPGLVEIRKRTAAADAEKALAESQKAKAQAELEVWKAKMGTIPEGPFKDDVTLKDNIGQLESSLLAVRAMREAVDQAVIKIKEISGLSKVLIYPEGNFPAFENLISFRLQKQIVADALNKAIEKSKAFPPASIETAPVAAAGMALEAFYKLSGFFRSDYTAGGVTVQLGDSILVKTFADVLKRKIINAKIFVPAIYDPQAGQGAGLLDDLMALFTQHRDATTEAAIQQKAIEDSKRLIESDAKDIEKLGREIAAAKDPKKKEKLEQQSKDKIASKAQKEKDLKNYKEASDGLNAAFLIFDKFFARLTATDEKSGLFNLTAIAREASVEKYLQDGAYVLIVKIDLAGGGYYVKKNLWTFFGGIPLWHMGGASVSFILLEGKTGAVSASGAIPIHGGFVKAGQMQQELAKIK